MKENKNKSHEYRHEDDDQLRENTMNETIREVSGDTELNDTGTGSGDKDLTRGVNYTPNDSSGVRSGGTTDMDDQTAGGAGLNTDVRKGSGSHLKTKDGISGSDYDGQNATS
jgi:hypothetical protein